MSELRNNGASGKCGACGEPIHPDPMTVTTCSCARRSKAGPADGTYQHSLIRRLWESQLSDASDEHKRLMAESAQALEDHQRRCYELEKALQSYSVACAYSTAGKTITAQREQIDRLQFALTAAQQRIAEAEQERDALLSDWNAIVAASGSPTHGGAVGVVAEHRRRIRELEGLNADKNDVDNLPNGNLPSGDI